MSEHPKISVIIPSWKRPDSLKICLESLEDQDEQRYEIILVQEEGPLAKLRNQGAKRAKGRIIVFIDDDVWCPSGWLTGILQGFKEPLIAGVSGPAIIRSGIKKQRDLFRFEKIKKIYDRFFLEGRQDLPGHFTRAGAFTTGATNESCSYFGNVEFLEACNMAFRREVFELAGGFDEAYGGIGDWSEPDLAFRIRAFGYKLYFNPEAALYHNCSQSGAYSKRNRKCGRMENYRLFSRRWIRPHWRHSVYKLFLQSYYFMKEHQCI